MSLKNRFALIWSRHANGRPGIFSCRPSLLSQRREEWLFFLKNLPDKVSLFALPNFS